VKGPKTNTEGEEKYTIHRSTRGEGFPGQGSIATMGLWVKGKKEKSSPLLEKDNFLLSDWKINEGELEKNNQKNTA